MLDDDSYFLGAALAKYISDFSDYFIIMHKIFNGIWDLIIFSLFVNKEIIEERSW